MVCDARELFFSQRRFDLIFKYLYVAKPNNAFVRRAYLESICAFNGYLELNPSNGIPKDSPEKFIASFDALIMSMQEDGFRTTLGGGGGIPIGANGEIYDGAHRLSVAAALGLTIKTRECGGCNLCDYRFFKRHNMASVFMDYGTLEYVSLNPNAHIVCLNTLTDLTHRKQVESALDKAGFVYYKKLGWHKAVYVFVCNSKEKMESALSAISAAVGDRGEKTVHISTTHDVAKTLAAKYFGGHLRLREWLYTVRCHIYRKVRKDNGVRCYYLFGIKVFSYHKKKRYIP